MFFADNLWVRGTINGSRVTIASGKFPANASTYTNIIVNSSTYYSNFNGSDTIALIAQNNIIFGLMSDNNLTVDAALIRTKRADRALLLRLVVRILISADTVARTRRTIRSRSWRCVAVQTVNLGGTRRRRRRVNGSDRTVNAGRALTWLCAVVLPQPPACRGCAEHGRPRAWLAMDLTVGALTVVRCEPAAARLHSL